MRWITGMTVWVSLLAAGCSGSGGGIGGGPVPLQAVEHCAYAGTDSRGSQFRLVQDVTIDGQIVPKGQFVSGLMKGLLMKNDAETFARLQWTLPPQFAETRGPGDRYLYARRFGQKTWLRFDLTGPKPVEEQTPYTSVARVPYQLDEDRGWSDHDRWAAIESGAKRLVLFDGNGKPGIAFNNIGVDSPTAAMELLRQDGALLVHHTSGDRIYLKDGTPISPELPRLEMLDVRQSRWQGMYPETVARVFGVKIDPKANRYWLILDNGRTLPKPDDLLGLEPLKGKNWGVWNGWLAWWKTPEGERCARIEVGDASSGLGALMQSRQRAEFVEYITFWNSDRHRFDDIVRRPGQAHYEVRVRDQSVTSEPLATAEGAESWLMAYRKAENEQILKIARERERALAQWEAEQGRIRAAEMAERLEALRVLKEQKLAIARRDFDAAMSANNKSMARLALLNIETDSRRWTDYVLKYGLDPANENTTQTIGYARAKLGETDTAVLDRAVQDAKAVAQANQSNNGGGSGSSYFYSGPSSNANYNAAMDSINAWGRRMEETNQRNFDAWMRGAQSWGGPR